MHAVDNGAQPYEGQRRQQRHPQDAQLNDYHPTAHSTFLMPDAQGTFTLSAEPASMLYDSSMTTLPTSSTPGQDSVFTPNAGSSFDSSMHRDLSYPPPSVYAQPQSFSLSPGSYYSNGQGLSPSQSGDHLSPEAVHLNDTTFQDHSNFTSSTYNNHVLDNFSNLNFVDNDSSNAFSTFQDMSLLTSGALNTYNAQPHNNASLEPHQQLLSPCMTANSSPVVGDDGSMYTTMHYASTYPTPPNQSTQLQHSTPVKQMQSPALTNSPGQTSLPNPRPLVRHLTQPYCTCGEL